MRSTAPRRPQGVLDGCEHGTRLDQVGTFALPWWCRPCRAAATWRREVRRPDVPNAVAPKRAATRNAGSPSLVPAGTSVRPYAGRISWSSGQRTNGVMRQPPPARRRAWTARASGSPRRSSKRNAAPPRACAPRRPWPGAKPQSFWAHARGWRWSSTVAASNRQDLGSPSPYFEIRLARSTSPD